MESRDIERHDRGLIEALNAPEKQTRLDGLRRLKESVKSGQIAAPEPGDDINNHIHTTYSFSCYSPARAVWEAYRAPLRSAGIMDHDSIRGAGEFIEAGAIIGIATTIGIECRVDFSRTPLGGRRINNPDQLSNAYIALHGIPHDHIDAFEDYFKPLILARHRRNRLMTGRINAALAPWGIALDYDRDVLPLSNHRDGGTVTERHLLFALALRLIKEYGKGGALVHFLSGSLGIPVVSKVQGVLLDENNLFYEYDLLGLLKGEFIGAMYVDAADECPEVSRVLAFAKERGCIAAYAYLGDVETSVTGDKRTQKFEDDYLDEVISVIRNLGFQAVTYMPSRNSAAQVSRIMRLCRENGLLEICGEDINSPRQPFICTALRANEFRHLVDMTWALIGHEKSASGGGAGFFSPEIIRKYPSLHERIQLFKTIGASPGAASAP